MSGRRWGSLHPSPSKPSEAKAWAYTLRLLAHRPRTEQELRTRLTQRGWGEETVDQVILRARKEGLVNDRLFACLYAEGALLARPRSRRLVAAELRGRGVPSELAEKAAHQALPELSELELARRALAQRNNLWKGLAPAKVHRRAAAFLLRRGFPPDLIRAIVEEEYGPLDDEHAGGSRN